MKRYHPDTFKPVEEITMDELETYYSSGFIRKKDGLAVTIMAPLLVCMALFGRVDDILSLTAKYPLIDVSGWTPWLEKEEEVQKKSFFCTAENNLQHKFFIRGGIISTIFALSFSDIQHREDFKKLQNRMFFPEDELEKIRDSADEYTRMRLNEFLNG